MSKKQSTTRSVDRALDILQCFLYHGKNLSLMEISNATNLSSSTVHRIISALQDKGFVERNEDDKKYSLGYKIAELGKLCNVNLNNSVKDIAKPYMMDLSNKYNEDVRIFIVDGHYKLCIESIESTRSLRHIMNVGDKHILFKGAAGKVLLAYMDKSYRESVLKDTIITGEVLQKIKDKGYALSIGEKEEGLVGIAAPIFDINQNVIAAVSLSGPSTRFINEEIDDKIVDTISTAKKISEAYSRISA